MHQKILPKSSADSMAICRLFLVSTQNEGSNMTISNQSNHQSNTPTPPKVVLLLANSQELAPMIIVGQRHRSSDSFSPMNIYLYDRDPASQVFWQSIAQSWAPELKLIRLDCLPNHSPQESGIVVMDKSVFTGCFVRQLEEFCLKNRSQQVAVTGYQLSIDEVVELLRGGATMAYEKPFHPGRVQATFRRLVAQARESKKNETEYNHLSKLLSSLTPRERQVLDLVLAGVHNRISAEQLGVSVRTVEVRRSKVYRKLECNHLAELVRKIERLERLRAVFATYPHSADTMTSTADTLTSIGSPHLDHSVRATSSTKHL